MFDHTPRSNFCTLVYLNHVYIVQRSQVNEAKDKHSGVMKAARSLFCKRNGTVYRWMYPNITKYELHKRVLDAWYSAKQSEKDIYISEVTYLLNICRAISLSFYPFSFSVWQEGSFALIILVVNWSITKPSLFGHEKLQPELVTPKIRILCIWIYIYLQKCFCKNILHEYRYEFVFSSE
jgi:hypothetical protein